MPPETAIIDDDDPNSVSLKYTSWICSDKSVAVSNIIYRSQNILHRNSLKRVVAARIHAGYTIGIDKREGPLARVSVVFC